MRRLAFGIAGFAWFTAASLPAHACTSPRNFLNADRTSAEQTVRGSDALIIRLRVEQALVSESAAQPIALAYRAVALEALSGIAEGQVLSLVAPDLSNCTVFIGEPDRDGFVSGYVVLYPWDRHPDFFKLGPVPPRFARFKLERYFANESGFAWKRVRFEAIE